MAIALIAGLASAASAILLELTVAWYVAFAVGAGLSIVSRALMPSPDLGAQMSGRTVTTREAAHSRKIVYGRAKLGGNIVYLESTGTDNKYLYLVVVVAGHEIDAYESVWFNDEKIFDGTNFLNSWGTYVDIGFFKGDQTAADNSRTNNLVTASSKWTNNHKLLDTAYMVLRLEHDVDKFSSGLPNISTIIRGKKVLNPNGGATAWSQNPALCVYDYLRDTKYGLGETAANILTSSVNAAKVVCDQTVDLAAGGNQPRYTIDGVIDTAGSLKSNIELMVGSMAGRLIYSGGQFEIHAGEYVSPAFTVNESEIVGEISVQTKQSRRSAYNAVKGVFLSEADNYIIADYPAQVSKTVAGSFVVGKRYQILVINNTDFTAIGASANTVGVDFTATGVGSGTGTASLFLAQDGQQIFLDMALPFTINNIRAQRLARLALLRSRQQEAITIPCNLSALRFKIGDNISVSNVRLGYDAKVFEVVGYSMGLGLDGQIVVNVEAIETAASIWAWATSDEEVFLGGGEVALYDGTVATAPASVAVAGDTFITADGTTSSFFIVTWPASVDAFVDRYVVEWAITEAAGSFVVGKSYEILTVGNTSFTSIGASANTVGVIFTATGVGSGSGVAVRSDNYFSQETRLSPFTILNLESTKVYHVRVKAINELGVSSVYKSANQTAAIDTTAPSVPTNVAAEGDYRQITVSWTNPTQTDLKFIDVFRSDTSGGTFLFAGTTEGTSFVDTDLDTPKTFYYKVKAGDFTFNKSAFSAEVNATTVNVSITSPDNPGLTLYDGESGLPPSVTSARTSLSTNTATFYLKQDYKESLKLNLSYPVGALTSGSISGQTNAINSTMAAFKFQVFYALTSNASSFTQLGSDVSSVRKTTTDQLISNYYVKTTDLGGGNFRADLQTQSQVQALFNSLDGSSLGIIDDNYNLRETLVAYDFPAGEYVFKVVVSVTNGSAGSYPSSGSPAVNLARKVDAVGYQQFAKTGYAFALKPLYQPITIFRESGSNEIVRLSEGADTLELSAINSSGVPVQAFVGGGGSSATTWGARIQFDDDLDTYTNGGVGEFQIGINKSGSHLSLGTAPSSGGYPRGLNPGLSELRISSGRTDIAGRLDLGGNLHFSTKGQMSVVSDDLCVFSTTSSHSGLRFADGAIHPTDNTGAQSDSAQIDLGASNYRFNDIFARNATINTSDRNEKQDIAALSDAEKRVAVAAKRLLRKFKWKDAVLAKGKSARTHFGIVAQDLQAAFVAEGLDARDYGMFTSDTWIKDSANQTRLGVRYTELLAFIISAD